MKTRSSSSRPGFTLVEMLAVITIIVILVAAVVAGTGFVKDKQARSQARVQIEMLSNALEEYRADTGAFPVAESGARSASNIIYRALYWDTDNNGSGADTDNEQKIYLPDLNPENSKQGWIDGKKATAKLIDPWGNEYHFRSGKTSDGDPNPNAVNPDFDIWSSGPDGKTNDSGDGQDTKDDIRNF